MNAPQDVKETVKGIGFLVNLREKYPVGFTVVFTIVAFFIGARYGRWDSAAEIDRLSKQNITLQKDQAEILKASLAKNGIIEIKKAQNEELQLKNDTLRQMNDTLSTTINQVGQTLLKAKEPAIEILKK